MPDIAPYSDADINAPDFGEGGKNKVKSIKNASQALAIAQRLDWDDRDRDKRRARVLAAFNGSAPYCDNELREKAQSYRYNVSFGHLEGVIGRAVVPYNELIGNIDNLSQMDADLPEDKLAALQQEFENALKNWGKWPKFGSRLTQEVVLNGYCTTIFPSRYDPWPIFVPQKEGFVNEGTLNDVNDLELFVWKKSYLIHELYNKIEDEKAAKDAGWNVENVRKALMAARPDNLWYRNSTESGSWTAVESAIRGGSLFTSIIGARTVNTFHVFASEIDGSVTQYVVLNDGVIDETKDSSDTVELFKHERRFGSMTDILVYFDLEAGDGKWHGSRSLGQRAFNIHKAIDKLYCSVLDQAFVSGLSLLQPGDQSSQEDFQLAVVGPFAVIPSGITIGTSTIPAISSTTFQAAALLTATGEQRTGDIVPNSQSAITQSDKTATEARISANRQALISRGNLQRFVDPVSQVLSIIVRRLLMENSPNSFAQKFQECLREKGLTTEDFKKVKGAKSTGRIDEVLGENRVNSQVVFAEFRGDPDIDQIELKRRRLTAIVGPKEIEGLLITEEDQTKQIESDRESRIEIGTMLDGIPVPASPRDNHEIHLASKIGWLAGQLQGYMKGQPGAALEVLKLVLTNAAQHLQFLNADKTKKQLYDQAKDRLTEIAKAIEEIEKQAAEMAKRQIPQAGPQVEAPAQPQPESVPV